MIPRAIVMSFMAVGSVAPLILMLVTPYVNAPKELEFMFSEFIMPTKIEWLYLILNGSICNFVSVSYDKSL